MPGIDETHREMLRLSELIDQRLDWVKDKIREYAEAEAVYRKAKAVAWLEAPRRHEDGEKVTANEREAMVNAKTADERQRRDVAEGLKQAGYEAVRSARQQLSAWQSRVASDRAEAEFARTGPR
jgi:hypothetical protein